MTSARPLISYHRGGSETATHKPATRDAYHLAIEQNAELIEFDVRRSKDHVLFCAHDEHDQNGNRLAELTWDEIAANNPEIATYKELLQAASGRSFCHIDLKETGYEDEAVALAIAELDNVSEAAWFTSLEDSTVRTIREIDDSLIVALSLGRNMEGKPRLETLLVRLSEILPFYRLVRSRSNAVAVNYRLATRGLKLFCGLSNRIVMVWTVNDDRRIEKYLTDKSVDVLITDRPVYATNRRNELAETKR